MAASVSPYPLLFSEWRIRHTTVPNRVVFAPTCPTWVADPHEGVFTDQAVAYYEERAKSGCGSSATTEAPSRDQDRARLPTWAPMSKHRPPFATNGA